MLQWNSRNWNPSAVALLAAIGSASAFIGCRSASADPAAAATHLAQENFNKGVRAWQTGDWASAEKQFKAAVEADPNGPFAAPAQEKRLAAEDHMKDQIALSQPASDEPIRIETRRLYARAADYVGKKVIVRTRISQSTRIQGGTIELKWSFMTTDLDGTSKMGFFMVDPEKQRMVDFLTTHAHLASTLTGVRITAKMVHQPNDDVFPDYGDVERLELIEPTEDWNANATEVAE